MNREIDLQVGDNLLDSSSSAGRVDKLGIAEDDSLLESRPIRKLVLQGGSGRQFYIEHRPKVYRL